WPSWKCSTTCGPNSGSATRLIGSSRVLHRPWHRGAGRATWRRAGQPVLAGRPPAGLRRRPPRLRGSRRSAGHLAGPPRRGRLGTQDMVAVGAWLEQRVARVRSFGVREALTIEGATLRRVVKSTVAGVLAWEVAALINSPRPVLAPLGAILVVQVTV